MIGGAVFFGLFEGPSKQEGQQYNALSGASSAAIGTGTKAVTAGTDFMEHLLSGDPTRIAGALSPEISAEKTSLQQDQKTQTMLGGRSGGTAAANTAASDKVHSDITNLIGGLQQKSAGDLASIGTSLLGTGISGTQAAFGAAKEQQAQKAAQWNDIFKSAASVAGGVIGGLPGNPGGWEDIASNALGG